MTQYRDTQRHRGTEARIPIPVPHRLGVLFWVAVASLLATLASPVAAQIGGRATRPQVVPPQGAARKVIFTYCTSCHGIDDYAYNALDRAGWSRHIDAKHVGLTVTLPAAEREILLDWLVERFGPTTKPFPRAYVAQEITTFFSDADGEALLKRACTSCHELDRVNKTRATSERWRVMTLDMRERGAKIEDAEIERLAEWLGRTRGTNDIDRQ